MSERVYEPAEVLPGQWGFGHVPTQPPPPWQIPTALHLAIEGGLRLRCNEFVVFPTRGAALDALAAARAGAGGEGDARAELLAAAKAVLPLLSGPSRWKLEMAVARAGADQ